MLNDTRTLMYRKILVVVLAAVLSAGYLVFTAGGSATVQSAPVAKDLTPTDLLLAAASAQGITMTYGGVTTAGGGDAVISSFQFGTNRPLSDHVPSGAPHVSEVTVTKSLDRYSTKFLLASLN